MNPHKNSKCSDKLKEWHGEQVIFTLQKREISGNPLLLQAGIHSPGIMGFFEGLKQLFFPSGTDRPTKGEGEVLPGRQEKPFDQMDGNQSVKLENPTNVFSIPRDTIMDDEATIFDDETQAP